MKIKDMKPGVYYFPEKDGVIQILANYAEFIACLSVEGRPAFLLPYHYDEESNFCIYLGEL